MRTTELSSPPRAAGPPILGSALALARDPGAFLLDQYLRQVVAELDAVLGAGPLSAARLRQLDVLHRTILETMRLNHIAPALTRTVTSAFEFGGYTIEPGEAVIIGTTVAHRLPQFYPEPDRFDIDRYRPGRHEHQRPGTFAPFGIGAHTAASACG